MAEIKRNGIGFENLCEVGFIIEGNRIMESLSSQSHKFERISSFHLDMDWYIFNGENARFALVPSQGASISVNTAERLLASGAKYIIRLGTCGSLAKNVQSGHTALHTAGIKDEGTSNFYIDPRSPAISDIETTIMLSEFLRQKGQTVHNGIIWTTDGRRKESHTRTETFIQNGANTVDMETSALFSFGLDRKVSVLSISIVEDFILENQEADDKEKRFKTLILPEIHNSFFRSVEFFDKIFNQ